MRFMTQSLVTMIMLVGTTAGIQAQNLGDLLGGIIQAAQAQAAADAWTKQPETRRYCVERALGRQNTNLGSLIRAGVLPDDGRLSLINQDCRRFEQPNFRVDYRCTISGERNEPINTTCSQGFMRPNGQRLDARMAIDVFFGGGQVQVGEFETEMGRASRQQFAEMRQRAEEIGRLRPIIDGFVASPLPLVQARARELLNLISAASGPGADVSAARRDELQKQVAALRGFSLIEEQRAQLLAPVERVRAQLASLTTTSPDLPKTILDEQSVLEREVTLIARPSTQNEQRPTSTALNIPQRIGPSFDCERARTPLAQIICGDDQLRRVDIAMVQPYQILRHLQPDERAALRDEAVRQSEDVARKCRLPANGRVPSTRRSEVTACVTGEYQAQTRAWRMRVAAFGSPAAIAEASRDPQVHVRVQALLAQAGMLPTDQSSDGVYGSATRAAISTFQRQFGLPPDGLVSGETLLALENSMVSNLQAVAVPVVDDTLRTRLAALEQRYAQLLAQTQNINSDRSRVQRERAAIDEVASLARDIERLAVPPRIAEAARLYLAEVEALGPITPTSDAMGRAFLSADQNRREFLAAIAVARVTTPRNAFLIDGTEDDIFVLVNQTPHAPSLTRNLRGEWVFQPSNQTLSEPVACAATRTPDDPATNRFVNEFIAREHPRIGRQLRLPAAICDPRQFGVLDVVVMTRDGLLLESPERVVALLSAVDSGLFAVLSKIAATDLAGRGQAEAVQATDIETGVERGTRRGFGMLFADVKSAVVCKTVSTDQIAHDQAIRPLEKRVADEMRARPTYVATSVDTAFISVRRGQCGAVYGAADDLRDLAAGLRREQVSFRFLPVWVTLEQLEAARLAVATASDAAKQAETDRARMRADEEQLIAARANTAEEQRSRRQAELQREHRTAATAYGNVLAAEMKVFLEGVSADSRLLNNEGVTRFGTKYPDVYRWYAGMLADQWQVMTLKTELLDYGVVDYRGRPLDTGFATSQIRLRNRILGEYRDICFITGFIDDREFSMQRDAVSSSCNDTSNRVNTFKTGQRFTSRWIAP